MAQKTIFLTGATGDIGKAIADKFLQEKYHVIAPTRKEMNLENDENVEHYLATIKTKLDVVIHCAGFNEPKLFTDINAMDLQKTMQINALSFYKMIQCFMTQNNLQQHAYILGVSSIYGFLTRKGRFSYTASKHCLHGMIKTLALELGHMNIKANVISPGFVDTKMTRKNNSPEKIANFTQKIPLERLASPEDIAEVAYFMCSPQNRFITGQEIVIDGGYSIGGFEP